MAEMKRFRMRFYLIMGTFLLIGLIVYIANTRQESTKMNQILIPMYIEQWVAQDLMIDPGALNLIQPDAFIYRNYHRGNKQINLYLSFYSTMDKSDLAHSPLVCYPGQGWVIRDTIDRHFLISQHDTLDLKRMIIDKGNDKEIVLYWFQSKGYSTANLGAMRMRLFWNKLFGGINENCFVRVSTALNTGDEGVEEEMLLAFIKLIYPRIEGIFER